MQNRARIFSGIIGVLLILTVVSVNTNADNFIVKDGKPNAEIIVAEKPLRSVQLAALELQHYIEKITGAKLEIVHAPTGKQPLKIYIGKSRYTESHGHR